MARCRVEVECVVTKVITRHITVTASGNEEAEEKTAEKFYEKVRGIEDFIDIGTPKVNRLEWK